MSMIMSRDNDLTTRNDGKRLSEINLIKDEWVAIKQLIKILEPFAAGTEGIISSNEIDPEEIDHTNHSTIFDRDIGIEDLSNDDETDNHLRQSINTLQDCDKLIEKVKSALYIAMNRYWDVPQDEAMIATFLDPRCKSLNFASETQKLIQKIS